MGMLEKVWGIQLGDPKFLKVRLNFCADSELLPPMGPTLGWGVGGKISDKTSDSPIFGKVPTGGYDTDFSGV
jgi:hypothetical protein